MSPRRRRAAAGALLEHWRPPGEAGEPLGCLATTYTFSPGLFDEQCLARFLGIESEPDREDLAFFLERESRLGGVYAGVLVDQRQAGVEHSLRWDVLPVRIPAGKQHAKLSLLAWSGRVRVLVASANLTEPGYRTNQEVAAAVEFAPEGSDPALMTAALGFLRALVARVPSAEAKPPEVLRAEAFLDRVESLVAEWKKPARAGRVRQHLVFNLPPGGRGGGSPSSGALAEAVATCRGRGGSPVFASVASPFFDPHDPSGRAVAELCKSMARGQDREVHFAVPAFDDGKPKSIPRLAAPRELLTVPPAYRATVGIHALPAKDGDGNLRAWHAKVLRLSNENYSALLIGSSNFTCAGLGVGIAGNAEANLLTIVDRVAYGREAGELEATWPTTREIESPEEAEWLGAKPELDEEETAGATCVPAGFLCATYLAGDQRRIELALEGSGLPAAWAVFSVGRREQELFESSRWTEAGRPAIAAADWEPPEPPDKLRVEWPEGVAFLPLNVSDQSALPPPSKLESMSAEDMLGILAASDPSAAFRLWAGRKGKKSDYDEDLDSASPVDLDPLRRHDLQKTFLHRIRRRARILALLRLNLERPVWGSQALEWRLRGIVGLEALAERFLRELRNSSEQRDEALLTLADFLIVLREVDYKPVAGALTRPEFERIYRPFLHELAAKLAEAVREFSSETAEELLVFWNRVEERCQS